MTIEVLAAGGDLALAMDEGMAGFLGRSGRPDCTVTASWSEAVGVTPGEPAFDSGPLWKAYRDGGRVRFVFTSPAQGPLPYKEASFEQGFSSGEVLLRRSLLGSAGGVWPLEYPLDELIVQGLLARGRGAEVHACGVADASGRGLLFVGQSETGKTTMARLWQGETGVRILSDDRIIVRREGGRFLMYGTPWHGEAGLADPGSVRLAGVFFLAHGAANTLVPLGAAPAAARLVSCGFPPFYDREGLDFTVGFFGELATGVPCHELRFVPDQGVVGFVRARADRP